MILQNSAIEDNNLYGYHITQKKELGNIKVQGLIPMCGERSKSIGDNLEAIYFFPALMQINDWISVLYKKQERELLELLRFSLLGIEFKVNDAVMGDFFTTQAISPDSIQILNRIDCMGNPYTLENLLSQDKERLIWEPIKEVCLLETPPKLLNKII